MTGIRVGDFQHFSSPVLIVAQGDDFRIPEVVPLTVLMTIIRLKRQNHGLRCDKIFPVSATNSVIAKL